MQFHILISIGFLCNKRCSKVVFRVLDEKLTHKHVLRHQVTKIGNLVSWPQMTLTSEKVTSVGLRTMLRFVTDPNHVDSYAAYAFILGILRKIGIKWICQKFCVWPDLWRHRWPRGQFFNLIWKTSSRALHYRLNFSATLIGPVLSLFTDTRVPEDSKKKMVEAMVGDAEEEAKPVKKPAIDPKILDDPSKPCPSWLAPVLGTFWSRWICPRRGWMSLPHCGRPCPPTSRPCRRSPLAVVIDRADRGWLWSKTSTGSWLTRRTSSSVSSRRRRTIGHSCLMPGSSPSPTSGDSAGLWCDVTEMWRALRCDCDAV